jgi:hypothetical protein
MAHKCVTDQRRPHPHRHRPTPVHWPDNQYFIAQVRDHAARKRESDSLQRSKLIRMSRGRAAWGANERATEGGKNIVSELAPDGDLSRNDMTKVGEEYIMRKDGDDGHALADSGAEDHLALAANKGTLLDETSFVHLPCIFRSPPSKFAHPRIGGSHIPQTFRSQEVHKGQDDHDSVARRGIGVETQ